MMKYACFLLIALSSILSTQAKLSQNDIKNLAESCNVKPEDYEVVKKFGVPDTESGKCLMLCMLKAVKTLDANGLWEPVGAKAGLDQHWSELEESYRSMIVETCGKQAAPWAHKANTCEYGWHCMKCINQKIVEKLGDLTVSQ